MGSWKQKQRKSGRVQDAKAFLFFFITLTKNTANWEGNNNTIIIETNHANLGWGRTFSEKKRSKQWWAKLDTRRTRTQPPAKYNQSLADKLLVESRRNTRAFFFLSLEFLPARSRCKRAEIFGFFFCFVFLTNCVTNWGETKQKKYWLCKHLNVDKHYFVRFGCKNKLSLFFSRNIRLHKHITHTSTNITHKKKETIKYSKGMFR